MQDPKIEYELAYDDDMKTVAVIFRSSEYISPDIYLKALSAWQEYCILYIHNLYKGCETLETDVKLN